jgi:hypothetical protein
MEATVNGGPVTDCRVGCFPDPRCHVFSVSCSPSSPWPPLPTSCSAIIAIRFQVALRNYPPCLSPCPLPGFFAATAMTVARLALPPHFPALVGRQNCTILAVTRVRQLARVLGVSRWSTESPGGPRTKRLDQLKRSGQCGRAGPAGGGAAAGEISALISAETTISVYPDVLEHQERYPYILDAISVYPDIGPRHRDIAFFFHYIGDFPISRPSRKGKSAMSGLISGILSRYRVHNPNITPVKKGVTIS